MKLKLKIAHVFTAISVVVFYMYSPRAIAQVYPKITLVNTSSCDISIGYTGIWMTQSGIVYTAGSLYNLSVDLAPFQSKTLTIGFVAGAAPTDVCFAIGLMPVSSWIIFPNNQDDVFYLTATNNCLKVVILGSSATAIDNGDGAPTRNKSNSDTSDCGMPVWSVSEPYISLWLKDEPLGYQPALGSRVSFELAFKQRESAAGLNPSIFGIGKRWNCSWLSYVAPSFSIDTNSVVSTNTMVYFPGGGSVTYYTTNDYLTQTTLTGDTTNGFTLLYPDGHKDIYSFIFTNSSGTFLEAFLSQHFDAQSNKITLNYYPYLPSLPVVRLKNVVDGDGRTNTITYATNNVYSTNLIAKVTDPFGRMALFNYNTNGDLTNMVDVMTNSTSFNYDTNDWVTNMTTPYGTTSFTLTDSGTNLPPNGRSVLITRPDGSHEYYLYQDNAPGIASAYPTNQVPAISP